MIRINSFLNPLAHPQKEKVEQIFLSTLILINVALIEHQSTFISVVLMMCVHEKESFH